MRPKRQNKQKDILFILISSFVVVIFWIGFNLYHIWVTSTISENIQLQLEPIDPTFDKNAMQQLRLREQISPAFGQIASQSALTPTPQEASSPTPITDVTPTATDASQITPTGGSITIQGQ